MLDFYYGDFRNQAFGYTLVVLFAVNTVSLLTGPAYDLLYLGGLSSPADYLLGVENLGMFLPLLLLRYYDGTRGTNRPWGKWLFYLFYPAHLLLLGLLAHILLQKGSFPLVPPEHTHLVRLRRPAALRRALRLPVCAGLPALRLP